MVELGGSSSGRSLRVQQKCAETGCGLTGLVKEGERRRVKGKKCGRSRAAAKKQAVVEKLSPEQEKDTVKAMEDMNLEHRKKTMLELFGDDSLPESTIEEVDDSSLNCETTPGQGNVLGECACSTCGDIGALEEELIRCERCWNRWQHRYCDASSEDSSMPRIGERQLQQPQPQPTVKRRRLESYKELKNVSPCFLSSKCSGMNGLDLLLEVARSVSECGGMQEEARGLSTISSQGATAPNTSGVTSALTQNPRKRAAGTFSLPPVPSSRNRVPASAVAGSPMHPQASRSSSSTVSGQKRKTLVVGTSTSPASTAEQWPSSTQKSKSLNGGSCATIPGLVPWERMKTGNRRYRLLSSMLC